MKLIKKLSVFFFAFYIFFLFKGIHLPYVGQNAYNFIIYSLIGHNYNQFGYLPTKFSSIVSVAKELPVNPEYFLHHPPLLSIILSLFFRILGNEFWVGRLPIALFAIGTIALVYLIEKVLATKKENLLPYVSVLVFAIIPASSIFGKLIGQETLVLFFALLSLYSALIYLKSGNVRFLLLGLGSSILGTLSDWPSTYFSIFLFALFTGKKQWRVGLLFPLASITTAVVLAIWISDVRSGLWDIGNAIALRSVAGLFHIPNWPVVFLGATILRFVVYFNPLFSALVVVCTHQLYIKLRRKKLSTRDTVLCILGLFGLGHVALYTEASFTHPYLIYYLSPFIAFPASTVLLQLFVKKKMLAFGAIIVFCFLYFLVVEDSKSKQVEAQIWRYEMARGAKKYMVDYETLIHNKFYAVDPDIFRFPLLINPKFADEGNSVKFLGRYNHYFYSCMDSCKPFKEEIDNLKSRYSYVRIYSNEAEGYLFFLKEGKGKKAEDIKVYEPIVKENIVIQKYRQIRDFLNLHQI